MAILEQTDALLSNRLAARLEKGEVVHFAECPFTLPADANRAFLLRQRLGRFAHKNISFDPDRRQLSGFRYESRHQAERLREQLSDFSREVTRWLAETLPSYAAGWRLDRATLRSEEEATRRLRLTARDDLLHVDAFPTRPSGGHRILRLYVNINETESRVCVTSERFAELLDRFGEDVGLPSPVQKAWIERLGSGLLSFIRPTRMRTAYDQFMLRMHNYLKLSEEFQDKAPKKFWNFAPGSAWLFFTDGISHATLRGRGALEHSYFISPETLALPYESPVALLQHASNAAVLKRAA